jgi:hypothetical protein
MPAEEVRHWRLPAQLFIDQGNGAQKVAAEGGQDGGAAIGHSILDQHIGHVPEEVVDGEGSSEIAEAALELGQKVGVFGRLGGPMLVTRAEAGGGIGVETATAAVGFAGPTAFKAVRRCPGSSGLGVRFGRSGDC